MYEKYGKKDYIGEPVSQIEHMCQCAQLAEANGADEETILAAFLHDIGHLCEYAFPETTAQHMDGFGIVDHEKLGAAFLLSKGFSKKITQLVQSHVSAKRYLTYAFNDYYNQLSDASKITLQHQGGIMTKEEAVVFENDLNNLSKQVLPRLPDTCQYLLIKRGNVDKKCDHLKVNVDRIKKILRF